MSDEIDNIYRPKYIVASRDGGLLKVFESGNGLKGIECHKQEKYCSNRCSSFETQEGSVKLHCNDRVIKLATFDEMANEQDKLLLKLKSEREKIQKAVKKRWWLFDNDIKKDQNGR